MRRVDLLFLPAHSNRHNKGIIKMEIVRLFVDKDFNIQGVVNPWVVVFMFVGILAYLLLHRYILLIFPRKSGHNEELVTV